MYPSGDFFGYLKDKTVDLIGLGVSHGELAMKLAGQCARLTVRDRRAYDQLPAKICEILEKDGVIFKLGDSYLDNIDADVLFRTPGLTFYSPELDEARAKGCAVVSEIELFVELCPCPVFGVTGSDGKTTTTTLISELLTAAKRTVHLGGNIGRPLLPILDKVKKGDMAVIELSSFQLTSFRHSPDISVITNVAPNHLDVHADMGEYIAAKENVLLHQGGLTRTVLSWDNDITRGMAGGVRGDLYWFSRQGPVSRGAYMNEAGDIYHNHGKNTTFIMNRAIIRIPGLHNVENYLAAIAATWGWVDVETIKKVAAGFAGVEHRIEFVREVEGVKYYNDSIATSPTRVMAGLRAFDEKLIVIAGGYDKKIPFEPVAPVLCEHAKMLILSGPTADKIEAAVRSDPAFEGSGLQIYRAESMEAATRMARELAAPGDIVTLSPACASFDAYPNFEARGRHFKEIVNAF